MNNHVFLKGNISQAPHFDRIGQSGRPFLRFYLAVDRANRTDFVRIVAYDDLALLSYSYLQIGSEVAVTGRLCVRTHRGNTIVEVISADLTFIRNINWEAGDAARAALSSNEGEKGVEPAGG